MLKRNSFAELLLVPIKGALLAIGLFASSSSVAKSLGDMLWRQDAVFEVGDIVRLTYLKFVNAALIVVNGPLYSAFVCGYARSNTFDRDPNGDRFANEVSHVIGDTICGLVVDAYGEAVSVEVYGRVIIVLCC